MAKHGRHRSTDKEGARALARIEAVPGVKSVIIGQSIGGKSIGSGAERLGFRIQRREAGGCKAVIQTSRGVQEIFVRIDPEDVDRVIDKLKNL